MNDTATNVQQELAFSQTWERLPEFEHFPLLEQLLHNEFTDPQLREQQLARKMNSLLQLAAQEIPYYQQSFAACGVDPRTVLTLKDLERIPILRRFDVVNSFDALRPDHVDPDSPQLYISRTSGSTGLPVRVLQSLQDLQMFAVLWVREARWFRMDISGRMARIRLPKHLFKRPGGGYNRKGESVSRPSWTYAGEFFNTGDEVHFNLDNSRAEQLRWLKNTRPAYLSTFPPLLEELALANDCKPLEGLQGVIAVASTLTPSMRSRVEQSFRVPILQGYGLNEFGLVATRCLAGRYHVHTENNWVEIVDDQGHAVGAGQNGRLVVTTLVNNVMPLIRYDTGDVARQASGPCACGRTLPSFEDVMGRYVRYEGTPPGTRELLHTLLGVVAKMDNELFANIDQYQFRQTLAEDFEVHIVAHGPLHPEFETRIQAAWQKANRDQGARRVSLVLVDEIEATPSGKQLDFVSEFQQTDSNFEAPPNND